MPKADNSTNDTAQPSLTPIYVVMCGFVFVCLGIVMLAIGHGTGKISLMPETPRQAYLRISSETHTGLRLAQLQDFAENYALNNDTGRARTARDALSAHEQRDWAKLTQTLYSLKSTDVQNTEALASYKYIWGVWNRQQDLPSLLQATGVVIISSADMHYAPNARRSKFAKGSGANILAGEIPEDIPQPDTTANLDASDSLELSSSYDVQNARIKYAKRPKYPRKAQRKGIEADVTLSLFIDERGNVARTEIVSVVAEKYRNSFARASKKAAMASKFHPKTVGGKPVATSDYLRKYTFTAEE